MSAEGNEVAPAHPAKLGQPVLQGRVMPGPVTVVGAPAEVDAATAGQLRAALLSAGSSRDTVVVDLSGSRFCDCAGLGVLIQAHIRARAAGGELRLLLPAHGIVPRLFALTGINQVIPAFTSLEDARREDANN